MGKGMSITGFVLSCLFFVPLLPLIGVVLSIIATAKAKNKKDLKGLAIAGIIVGVVSIFFQIALLLVIIKVIIAYHSFTLDQKGITYEAPIENISAEPETTRGDLLPKIYASSFYPDIDQDVEIKVSAQNYGVQRITKNFDYKVTLSKEGEILYESSGESQGLMLPANETVLETFNYKFTSYGDYELSLILDTKEAITELDESNNNKSVTIYVQQEKAQTQSIKLLDCDDVNGVCMTIEDAQKIDPYLREYTLTSGNCDDFDEICYKKKLDCYEIGGECLTTDEFFERIQNGEDLQFTFEGTCNVGECYIKN